MDLQYSDVDRQVFENELRDFLPEKILDSHVHIYTKACLNKGFEFPEKSCSQRFGGEFPIEMWRAYTEAILPDIDVSVNCFASPDLEANRYESARYIGSVSDNETTFGMALVSPKDSAAELRKRIVANNLIGYKPYLNFVDWKTVADIEPFDMLTPEQLDLANELGLAITFHIPRPGRLADSLNREQMAEMCKNWPNIKFIFAHIGRAYWMSCVEGYLSELADIENAFLDTAMVNHEGVLAYTFNNFPRERILFGSDAPIALLRGKSVEINNSYAYLMAEDYRIGTAIYDSENVVDFTSFFYEQLRGIKVASRTTGCSRNDIENIFYNNAYNLLKGIRYE